MHNLKFDRQFFKDFWNLLKPYWLSEEKYFAFGLLTLNILCVIGEVRASVAINNFSKNFYDALQTFNTAVLVSSLKQFIFILIALIIVVGYATYFNGLICIRWRRWLTKNYLKEWLGNHKHYRMQLTGNHVDNPDQRISEDLDQFPTATLSAFFLIFHSSLSLITFGVILWNLSGRLTIPIGSINITISGYLLWSAMLYAAIGTWITSLIGKKLAALNYKQQLYNADFRYSLVRFRESSEQIALYRGEENENKKFQDIFQNIFSNFINTLKVSRQLTFFKNGYNTVSFVFGLTIALPLYLQKKIQLGEVMQISGAFSVVIGAFSIFVSSFSFFAEWRAVIYRLTEFKKSMQSPSANQSKISIDSHESGDIILRDFILTLPNGKLLNEKNNYILRRGERYLVSGPSGVGKSTFLRAIAGLWPHGEGFIFIPKNLTTLFLPQKPYLPLGTLKDVLTYPGNKKFNDDVVVEAMQFCHLQKFQNELNIVRNWTKELSLGEQQLIAFCRIFLHQPQILFLDEATSALDEMTENDLYEKVINLIPNTTIISVGHRNSLNKHHNDFIHFSNNQSMNKIVTESLSI